MQPQQTPQNHIFQQQQQQQSLQNAQTRLLQNQQQQQTSLQNQQQQQQQNMKMNPRYRWMNKGNGSARMQQQTLDNQDFLSFEPDTETLLVGDRPMKRGKPNDEFDFEEERKYAPWMSKSSSMIRNPNVRLHNEIIELTNHIMPKQEDYEKRQLSIKELTRIIKFEMPNVEIKSFGSFSTKLYLPNADIDLVLIDTSVNKNVLLKQVAKILKSQSHKYTNIDIISSAKVPIIKFIDIENNYNIDVSFNKLDGIFQTREVLKSFKIYPEIKPLIFVMKIYLRQRNLNQTFTGGVGSFLLFCLILAFLRDYKKKILEKKGLEELKTVLLSEYLLKFLEFYSLLYDCSKKRIIMKDSGKIIDKPTKDQSFSLISPQCETHDIGNAAFRIKEVFNTFKNRFYFCTNYNFKVGESILKYLINPSKKDFAVYLK